MELNKANYVSHAALICFFYTNFIHTASARRFRRQGKYFWNRFWSYRYEKSSYKHNTGVVTLCYRLTATPTSYGFSSAKIQYTQLKMCLVFKKSKIYKSCVCFLTILCTPISLVSNSLRVFLSTFICLSVI